MTPEKLQEMYTYAWDTFYQGSGHALKMADLFKAVVRREVADGTYRRYEPGSVRAFGPQQRQPDASAQDQ
jgi:hypothetical protein